MFKLSFCITFAFMILMNMAISESEYRDGYFEDLYNFSIDQAELLTEQWTYDSFIDKVSFHRSDKIKSFVENENIDCPNLYWHIEPTEQFDIEKALDRNGLTPQMAMSEWFRIPSTVNASDVVYNSDYVLWLDWFSLYSSCQKEANMPEMMYTVLVYEDESPQIVTAFYAVSDTVYVTKTCFVYSELIFPESMHSTFPYQLSLWFEQLEYRLFDTENNRLKMIKDIVL